MAITFTKTSLSAGALSAILDFDPRPVFVLDDSCCIVLANQSSTVTTGYTTEELNGQHADVILGAELTDQLQHLLSEASEAQFENVIKSELDAVLFKKNLQQLPSKLHIQIFTIKRQTLAAVHVVNLSEKVDAELQIQRQDAAVNQLLHSDFIRYGKLEGAWQAIVEILGISLEAGRVSLWLAQEDTMVCQAMYESASLSTDLVGRTIPLTYIANAWPGFEDGNVRIIDTRTKLTFDHKKLHNAISLERPSTSAIYLPIIRKGQVVGMLSCESFRERDWNPLDFSFAMHISTAITIALDANELSNVIGKLETTNELLSVRNAEIHDSLVYARRLQESKMSSPVILKDYMRSFGLFIEPVQLVSGDFFWAKEREQALYFALGDCTGHGISGAMLSFLALESLNHALDTTQDLSPGEVLLQTHHFFEKAFLEDEGEGKLDAGMEIAVFRLDRQLNQFVVSSANLPIYIQRLANHKEVELMRPSPFGIGYSLKDSLKEQRYERVYENHELDVKAGDRLVVSSDGLPDQTGGEKERKLGRKGLINYLAQNAGVDASTLCSNLPQFVVDWRGESPQHDDLSLLAIDL